MNSLRSPLRILSLSFGLVLSGLVLVSGASGAFTPTLAPGSGGKGGKGGTGVLRELHAAKSLLEKADHDYKGHRARAVEEITAAIHDLTGGARHQAAGTAAATGDPKPAAGSKPAGEKKPEQGNKEAQAESDKQLREAKQLLQEAEPKLQKHPQAQAALKKAIEELDTALSIK